jgi:glycogen(starch) synthase
MPSSYLPNLGGVEELTRHLALTLRDKGDQVEVWVPLPDSLSCGEVESLDGLTVRRFPCPLPRLDPRAMPKLLARGAHTLLAMNAAVREFDPDVLHVQCFGPNGVYATALSLLTRVPLVVSLQGETVMDDHDVFAHSFVLRRSLRISFKVAARVTGCSQFTVDDSIARFGLDPEAAEVVFNGMQPQRADGALDVPYVDVLAVGRLVEKKGFDLLIRAFAAIADDHPNLTLGVGGAGPAQATLESLAAELRLRSRVHFFGRLSREEVHAAMRKAKVFVVPSRLEPFGIVILEAWAAGVPVIATSVGGPSQFVEDRKSGILVDPNRTDNFARVLDEVVRDDTLRHRIAEGGRARVIDFSWDRIADRYREIYAGLKG